MPGATQIPRGANFDESRSSATYPVRARAVVQRTGDADDFCVGHPARDRPTSRRTPARREYDRPAIYATFAADGLPVNPSSATFRSTVATLPECVRTAQFIQYLPPSFSYPDGLVRVTVRFRT